MYANKRYINTKKIKSFQLLFVIILLLFGDHFGVRNIDDFISLSVVSLLVVICVKFSFKLFLKWVKGRKNFRAGMNLIDTMSGIEFEEFLMDHFLRCGYKATLTPMFNDYGADLVLKKDGQKIVVQAKRWKSSVGVEAVQQVVGAVGYYKANKAIVITNSYFTENAKRLARTNNVELWDREALSREIRKSKISTRRLKKGEHQCLTAT